MAIQYPLDGKQGKDWKVTSPYGWRIHPIKKVKKHHNGVDIWQAKEPSYLEAWCDGKVIAVKENTDPNSAGNSVIVQSVVMGKKITWTYFHMVHKSIQVKKGQKISAGQVIGKMGATGFATGKHLHFEIWAGHRTSQPNINTGGKGFYDPLKFVSAAIEWEKVHKEMPLASDESVTTVMPNHSIPVEEQPKKPAIVNPVPTGKPAAKVAPTHKVAKGETYWSIGKKHGIDYKKLQKLNGNKPLHPGTILKLG